MKSLRFLDRRVGSSLAALGLLAGMVVPAALPAFASAATLDSRSIQMSSGAVSATAVTYKLTFTPSTTAGAFYVDFCDDSPIPGQTCTAPTGFTAAGATADHGTLTAAAASLKVVDTLTASSEYTVTFSGITNPSYVTSTSANEGFFARVQTYTDGTVAGTQHASSSTPGTDLDEGGIAMAITNPIQVSAAVRETMTFCVSAAAPTASCAGTTTPALVLGHGTPKALDPSATDTADAYAQVSTNASSGAIVNMKIDNDCGGLKRTGAAACDIAPVGTGHDPITLGTSALFGLHVGAQDTLAGGSGTVAAGANYGSGTDYGMNWVSGNATGVGSVYGDTIFNTSSAPINNVNVALTFGATVTNLTPAGLYKADLSLVATGTY